MLRVFQPYHQILCILKHVEDGEDRSNTPRGYNAMYVKDVEDGKRTYTHIFAHNFLNIQPIFNLQRVLRSWDSELFNHTIILCILKHVEDVEDRSNTHKGCNGMYVEDVEDIKTSYNRFPLVYSITVGDVKDVYKLQCRF